MSSIILDERACSGTHCSSYSKLLPLPYAPVVGGGVGGVGVGCGCACLAHFPLKLPQLLRIIRELALLKYKAITFCLCGGL